MAQTNTLFSRPTLQNNNLAGHYSMKGPNFKTSNPEIFPSLHPLSGFYNQKKANPNPALKEKRESEVALEPVKKQRLNTGIEQQALNTEKVNIPVDNSSKQLTNNQNKKKDDYVFRVPQLPRRLREHNKNESAKVETSIVNAPFNLGTTMSGFEMQESLNYNPAPTTLNKKTKATKSNKSQKTAQLLETANEVQHQSVDQGVDQMWLGALYEKLIYEYYALQLVEQSNQNYLTQMAINNMIRGQNNRDSLLIL